MSSVERSSPRKIWGWGLEGEGPDETALAFAEASLAALLGGAGSRRAPPTAAEIALRAPRVNAPAALASLLDTSPHERLAHSLGRSYRDIARAVAGHFPNPPDLVAFPRTEADVARLLDHANASRLAVVPFGGGSSVSGGVEAYGCDDFAGVMTIDLRDLVGIVELDRRSLAAHVRGGTFGPALEAALKPAGLTLRHYPQSFEQSTVGGWIATRAGGHFATGPTHIDDLVEAVELVTPTGTLATRRLPGSGAGPDANRLVIGSEGALGVITSAWLRLVERPTHRASATLSYATFEGGLAALRAIVQSGLLPSNARLVDGAEAIMSGAGAGDACLLLLAFESAAFAQDAALALAVDLAKSHGGVPKPQRAEAKGRDATADTYKRSFFRAPYLRDELILRGIFVETFETATTWAAVETLDQAVRDAVEKLDLGPHLFARRITHAYRDGCAPYYTVIAKARAGSEDAMWWDVKAAITDAIMASGGTSTHHHAVGRDVMRWYDRERSAPYARALAATKRELDPLGVMNPGVLVPRAT
ncbi:MAG: FAD-binding oxidoreductase [Myxococcales bacterium]|nr:FAD-binding oxidoreductase [Myxococcales bacterium]